MKKEKGEMLKEMKISKGGFLFLVAYTVALAVLFVNLPKLLDAGAKLLSIISPFTIGFALAFLINIPMTFFEKKVFGFLEKKESRIWNKIKRVVCFLLSAAIIYFVIVFLGSFIYREIYKSIADFSKNLPGYAEHLQKVISDFFGEISPEGFFTDVFSKVDWVSIAQKIATALAKVSPNILNLTLGVTSALFNFVMAIIFACYLLFGKEKLISHIKKIMRAYLSKKSVIKLRYVTKVINVSFTKFTVGQLMETVILGTLYFAGASIFKMPYPALIGVLMAIGGIIPVIGPIITAVPSALIVVMAGGVNQALWFVVMAVIIQQVESNIIYPKVIGESVGLPGIWVLLSVLIGGSGGGIAGMIIAVPTASVIYTLLRKDVNKKLKIKGKKIDKNQENVLVENISVKTKETKTQTESEK